MNLKALKISPRLLSEGNVQLERNVVNNAQYHRHESIEINPVPASISNEELEDNVCKALSLTGHEVIPDDLQAFHRLKKKRDCDCKIQIQETEMKNPY